MSHNDVSFRSKGGDVLFLLYSDQLTKAFRTNKWVGRSELCQSWQPTSRTKWQLL